MRIINEHLLGTFRQAGRCGWCGVWSNRRQPHHYFFARGRSNGTRFDVSINLIALGWTFICPCHDDHHVSWNITKEDFMAKVAARERVLQPSIESVMHLLYQLSKSPTVAEVARRAEGLTVEARALARRTFLETPEHKYLAEALA